jgi:hypothetical protein
VLVEITLVLSDTSGNSLNLTTHVRVGGGR